MPDAADTLHRAETLYRAGDPAPSVNLGAALLATGDAQGALWAASEACHRAPGLAAAHYTYGLAWPGWRWAARRRRWLPSPPRWGLHQASQRRGTTSAWSG